MEHTDTIFIDRSVFNERIRNDRIIFADIKCDAGKSGPARKSIFSWWAYCIMINIGRNAGGIGADNLLKQKKDWSVCVYYHVGGYGVEIVCANDIVIHSESPFALTWIDGHVSYTSGMFGIINESEIITAGSSIFQVCSE